MRRPFLSTEALIFGMLVLIVAFCWWSVVATAQAKKECAERDGQWIKTGTSWVNIFDDKGQITGGYWSDDYGCSK